MNACLAFIIWVCIMITQAVAQPSEKPFAKYKIIPNPKAASVTVEAQVELQNRIPYIKDFGQLESVKWLLGGKELAVKPERLKEIVMFQGLPTMGKAKAVYTIKFATQVPGITKLRDVHFLIGPDYLYIAEGLFLGLNGKEIAPVDVQWDLPEGWILGLGRPGLQTFHETQQRFWVAGRMKYAERIIVEDADVQIAAIESAANLDMPWVTNAVSSVFQYAWRTFGKLKDRDFGIAVFPKGIFPKPGFTRWNSIVVTSPVEIPHEILHFWRINAPAWFREGILEYVSRKIMVRCGLMNDTILQLWLRAGLVAHSQLVSKRGILKTLAQSSDELEQETGGEDIYALMPCLAYRLDKDIQKQNPKTSLEDVFAAASRKPIWPALDVLALIKETTGYDPKPLFDKYFYGKIENPEELLK